MPYREIGNRWMNFTLQHQVKSKDNSAGYYNVKFSKEDDKIIELNDNGLMNGISGVGLCLLVESVGLNLCEDLLIL